ncbi:vWA domain-containing protein [Pseudoramibacter porci]|uniref:VWA domain-containing protein n=1 Tax=Pseudoramibacter porci TaxID=2606631 RepID=A0A7X2T9Z8_9FIRM|nr:vWA domain-containing protein [Pseudoramibacter porci]MSS20019.1 VWA domain-containing protein [Pseudoramibacter porci]
MKITKNIIQRLIVGTLVILTTFAFGLTSVSFASGSDAIQWDHSKSKTATNLDSQYTSNVTLSLPSKEEKLSSDIVFIMDKSSCKAETADKMGELLTQLQTALKNSDATVKIAMIAFDGTDHTLYPLTKYNGSNPQIETIKKCADQNSIPTPEKVSGTNMQAGLDRAKRILNGDSSVSANRKYVVLVSDGLTRLFGTNGQVKDIYYKGQYSYNHFYGMIDEWDQVRFGANIPKGDNYDPYCNNPNWTWGAYWSQVQKWVAADGDKYVSDFLKYGNDAGSNGPDHYLTDTGVDAASDHAMAVDRAVYEAYNAYSDLVKKGYRCYAVNIGTSRFGQAFMGALNGISGNQAVSFDQMKDNILYVVGAGSSITDKIGCGADYNFDLKDPDKMVITIDQSNGGGTQTYKAVKIGENHYGFGPKLDNGKYSYEVTYTPGDKKEQEHFVWTMNVNVSNFSHVSLTYTVKLMNPKSAPGTYGQLDLNGDGIIDGTQTPVDPQKALYTNVAAGLSPVSSTGAHVTAFAKPIGGGTIDRDVELFGKPSVTYTVKAPDTKPQKPSGEKQARPQTSKNASAKVSTKPKTGDNSNAALYALIMAGGAAALAVSLRLRKKAKSHE